MKNEILSYFPRNIQVFEFNYFIRSRSILNGYLMRLTPVYLIMDRVTLNFELNYSRQGKWKKPMEIMKARITTNIIPEVSFFIFLVPFSLRSIRVMLEHLVPPFCYRGN